MVSSASSESPAVPSRFLQIDEDGYFKMGETRISDQAIGRDWLKALNFDPKSATLSAHIDGHDTLVEAFDAPYVVLQIEKTEDLIKTHSGPTWKVKMPYGHEEEFLLETLSLDEWDRFHGRTERGIPFVFSRQAQASFFDMLDEFDDDSIQVDGKHYDLKPWLEPFEEADASKFWNDRYVGDDTPWDTRRDVYPPITRIVPQLKLMKSRILVPGCGRGHDAAWFAQQGHIVTALDYSAEAIKQAKELYGNVPGLTFAQADVFNLPQSYDKSFDLVFEHTLYCAVLPERRNDLVKVWRRALVDNGHLLALMFASEKKSGPPFGGSEWEIRQRLAKNFRPLYWQRLRDSMPRRMGTELLVYSQKVPNLR